MDGNRRLWMLSAVLAAAVAVPYVMAMMSPAPPPAPQAAQQATPGAAEPPAAGAAAPEPPAIKPARTAAQVAERLGAETRARLETDSYIAEVSSLNGGLRTFQLKGQRYEVGGKPLNMVTTDKEPYLPLAIGVDGWPSQDAVFTLHERAKDELQVSLEEGGLLVTRKLQGGRGPFQLWVTTQIKNTGAEPRKVRLRLSSHHYVAAADEGTNIPGLPARNSATSNAVCRHAGEQERLEKGSFEGEIPQAFAAPIEFTGIENVYFLSAVAPEAGAVERCSLRGSARGRDEDGDPIGTLFSAELTWKTVDIAPGASHAWKALAYLGPKSPEPLTVAGHSLKHAIETGWFTTLAEGLTWLLRWIYDGVGNWGIAIILLTFLVRLVLLPVTIRQMQSMGRMKELKPDLDRINTLYGDDREKKGAAMMELYRKRGVNPLSGCLPTLLQLPIWFSLYASLSSNVELYHAPFALWWSDLSSPDQFFVLPLALGVLMFVQQKMTPATGMDPVQQKMMLYMMPTMITSFMLFLPAGLCLYMFTNSALGIAQQRVIEARLKASAPPAEPESPLQSSQQSNDIPDAEKSRPERSARPSKAERRWRRGKR